MSAKARAFCYFPPAFLDFVALFNRGAYWESHEVLEAPWRECRSGFYKGLILLASAFVHVQRRNARGVMAQLEKAERHLASYQPRYLGLDVGAILEHAAVCRRIMAEWGNADSTEWARLIPRLRLEPRADLVRGDEVELRQ